MIQVTVVLHYLGREYSQNGDRLKRRQAKTATPKCRQTKTATCLLEVNQNGDKRERQQTKMATLIK